MERSMSRKRKRVIAGAVAAAMALGGGAVVAYYVAGGSGTGTGNAGSASTATVNQAVPVNADYSTGDGFLYPGTTQTVHLTVKNNGKANQYITNVTLSGWTSSNAGCNSATDPGWFAMPAVAVAQDLAAGATSTNTDGVITFVDEPLSQNVCEGATLTFDYTSS
jgi:hypothetical protein